MNESLDNAMNVIYTLADKQYKMHGWRGTPHDAQEYEAAVDEMANMIRDSGALNGLSSNDVNELLDELTEENFHLEAKAIRKIIA